LIALDRPAVPYLLGRPARRPNLVYLEIARSWKGRMNDEKSIEKKAFSYIKKVCAARSSVRRNIGDDPKRP
jgi:hypothetical protein